MARFSPTGTVSVRPYVDLPESGAADSPVSPSGHASPEERWVPLRLIVVGLCFVINMIDGIDVLMMSYVAPALSQGWSISPSRLGVVFSAGLAGMAAGGIGLAPLADRFGRKRLILGSLALMAASMIVSGLVSGVDGLIAARFCVGVGIGTVLASMAALTAEYAPPRHRNFAVGLLQAGYPIGATLSGFVVASLIPIYGWQSMLIGSGVLSSAMLPVIFLAMPESVDFLLRRQPPGALRTVNRIEGRLAVPGTLALPAKSEIIAGSTGVRGLFADGRAVPTVLLWVSLILCFMTLYFVISWIPKLAIAAGLTVSRGIYAGAIYNVGAFAGTVSIGLISIRFDLRRLIFLYLAIAAVALMVFGSISMPLFAVLATAFAIGVSVQGGFNGHYSLAAALYPPEIRGTGIGWAMGIGRIGAVTGPILGGFLLQRHVPLPILFATFAVPVVIGGTCVLCMRLQLSPRKDRS